MDALLWLLIPLIAAVCAALWAVTAQHPRRRRRGEWQDLDRYHRMQVVLSSSQLSSPPPPPAQLPEPDPPDPPPPGADRASAGPPRDSRGAAPGPGPRGGSRG